jgi:NADH dehydrogenase
MRVLVTGGTGFVGPQVVRAVAASGHDVRALVRSPDSKAATALAASGCELVPGDVTDPESVRAAVEGCDAVVHLVAIIKGSRADFERIMKQGTRNTVAAGKEAGVGRFVLMSALGTSERTKTLTPYYEAKWDEEQAVKESGLEHVILRPSFVFGPDGGTLEIFMRQVRWLPVVPVVGTRKLQPIWVEDVAAFAAAALTAPGAANRTLDLVGPDVVTWAEVFDGIKRALGKRRLTFRLPIGLARAGAAVIERLPTQIPISRDALTMLEFEDNVGDPAPAAEALGVTPIGLAEQLRRAAA